MDRFSFEDGGAKATGFPMEIAERPRFKVFEGSTARKVPSRIERRYADERQRLVADGTLAHHPSNPGLYIFTRDYEANSASMASGVISGGGNFSGPERWFRIGTSEALKDWLKTRL